MQITNPKTGEILLTSLTDAEAVAACRTMTSDEFATSLAKQYPKLSDVQRFWLFKKAEGANAPKPQAASVNLGGNVSRIVSMFDMARAELKRPKVHLRDDEGHHVCVSLAPITGRNAGFLYVNVANEYAGKISPQGQFFPVKECPATVAPYLVKFAADPERMAAEYGLLTGECCFCARPLCDEKSTDVGYGPVCAKRYGLAWGSRRPVAPVLTARTRVRE